MRPAGHALPPAQTPSGLVPGHPGQLHGHLHLRTGSRSNHLKNRRGLPFHPVSCRVPRLPQRFSSKKLPVATDDAQIHPPARSESAINSGAVPAYFDWAVADLVLKNSVEKAFSASAGLFGGVGPDFGLEI